MEKTYNVKLSDNEIDNIKLALCVMNEHKDSPGFLYTLTMERLLLKLDYLQKIKK